MYLKVVTAQHDVHDILADVVYVTIGRCRNDKRALHVPRLFLFDVGLQQRYCVLHDLGGLHHLRQEHLTLAKELADVFHSLHQRLLDDINGTIAIGLQRFGNIFRQIVGDAFR